MKSILKKKLRCNLTRLLLTVLFAVLLVGNACAETDDYEVHLSWFVDLQEYEASAHADLFCSQCHQAIKEQKLHPDPANVTRTADEFFKPERCAGSDCHENTLSDFEKGIHGRIHFENQQKYADCIDCHDPHSARKSVNDAAQIAGKKGRTLCTSVENQSAMPAECKADEKCLECHSVSANDQITAIEKERTLCFHCHDQTGQFASMADFSHMPTIDTTAYHTTSHAGSRCTDCHTRSATYGHDKQVQDCRSCHSPHDEAEINDAHVNVTCEACHLQGSAWIDKDKGLISWQMDRPHPKPTTVHHLIDTEDETSCARCHTENNPVGAVAMVLPAKSVICMSCHTATFTAGDTTTLVTLLGSFIIFLGLFSIWLSAGVKPEDGQVTLPRVTSLVKGIVAVVFSRRILRVIKAILLDVIIQRKLFLHSKWRWFSHGLIFYPFLLRFGWGMVTLLLSLVVPEWEVTGALLDKNHPFVSFVFDFTGILIILGVVLVVITKKLQNKRRWSGMPRQEWLSMTLIGGIILVGFILEGLRIAMTLDLTDKHFAFIGYTISLLFSDMKGVTEGYGYVWYLHAFLTAGFIIWLPFSRMFHIVMGPLVVAINAANAHDKH